VRSVSLAWNENEMKQKEISFYEYQNIFNLKCWYLWVLWLFIDGLFILGFVRQIIFHKQWGNHPMSDTGLMIVTALMLIFSLFFIFMRMETIIDNTGISIRYIPLLWRFRTIPWDEIEEVYVRKYNALMENRGWGIQSNFSLFRIGNAFSSSTAYTLYGNTGLQLKLKNGKRVLVGTQRGEEIEEILEQRTKSYNVAY